MPARAFSRWISGCRTGKPSSLSIKGAKLPQTFDVQDGIGLIQEPGHSPEFDREALQTNGGHAADLVEEAEGIIDGA
jgi:hypothetical protein